MPATAPTTAVIVIGLDHAVRHFAGGPVASGLFGRAGPPGAWTSAGSDCDPAHLWFLYVLLVFWLALLPLLAFLRGAWGARVITAMAGFAQRHPLLAVAAAALPMMAVEAMFGPDVNTGGWERTAYVFPFLYGFLVASDSRFETALARVRWAALATALPATAALIAGAGLATSGMEMVAGWGALQGLAGWAWLAAIAGFAASLAARRRTRPAVAPLAGAAVPAARWHLAARYATDAVLPFYLLHEPVIVVAARFIVRWQAPVPGKYALLVVVSFAATLALYELLIRRFRVSRFLFGMKGQRAP